MRDNQLTTTRLRRFAWRMECDTCPYEILAPNRAKAKANEAAHREWHAHASRASLAGPV